MPHTNPGQMLVLIAACLGAVNSCIFNCDKQCRCNGRDHVDARGNQQGFYGPHCNTFNHPNTHANHNLRLAETAGADRHRCFVDKGVCGDQVEVPAGQFKDADNNEFAAGKWLSYRACEGAATTTAEHTATWSVSNIPTIEYLALYDEDEVSPSKAKTVAGYTQAQAIAMCKRNGGVLASVNNRAIRVKTWAQTNVRLFRRECNHGFFTSGGNKGRCKGSWFTDNVALRLDETTIPEHNEYCNFLLTSLEYGSLDTWRPNGVKKANGEDYCAPKKLKKYAICERSSEWVKGPATALQWEYKVFPQKVPADTAIGHCAALGGQVYTLIPGERFIQSTYNMPYALQQQLINAATAAADSPLNLQYYWVVSLSGETLAWYAPGTNGIGSVGAAPAWNHGFICQRPICADASVGDVKRSQCKQIEDKLGPVPGRFSKLFKPPVGWWQFPYQPAIETTECKVFKAPTFLQKLEACRLRDRSDGSRSREPTPMACAAHCGQYRRVVMAGLPALTSSATDYMVYHHDCDRPVLGNDALHGKIREGFLSRSVNYCTCTCVYGNAPICVHSESNSADLFAIQGAPDVSELVPTKHEECGWELPKYITDPGTDECNCDTTDVVLDKVTIGLFDNDFTAVTCIPYRAFTGQGGEFARIPLRNLRNLKKICKYAFEAVRMTVDLTASQQLEHIDHKAFYRGGSSYHTDVTMKGEYDALTFIHGTAFTNAKGVCDPKVTDATKVCDPVGVATTTPTFGSGGCSGYKNTDIFDTLNQNLEISTAKGCVPDNAFRDEVSEQTVIFRALVSIGKSSFENSNLKIDLRQSAATLVSIETNAFKGHKGALRMLGAYESLKVFRDPDQIDLDKNSVTIYCAGAALNKVEPKGENAFNTHQTCENRRTGCAADDTILDQWNLAEVTRSQSVIDIDCVPNDAFKGYAGTVKLTFDERLKVIGKSAFSELGADSFVDLIACTALTDVGDSAFWEFEGQVMFGGEDVPCALKAIAQQAFWAGTDDTNGKDSVIDLRECGRTLEIIFDNAFLRFKGIVLMTGKYYVLNYFGLSAFEESGYQGEDREETSIISPDCVGEKFKDDSPHQGDDADKAFKDFTGTYELAGFQKVCTNVPATEPPTDAPITAASTATTTTRTTTTVYDANNVNCVEKQDECTAACQKAVSRNYVFTTAAVHNGRACDGASDCKIGEGGCKAVPTPQKPSTATGGGGGGGGGGSSGNGGAIGGAIGGVLLLGAIGVGLVKTGVVGGAASAATSAATAAPAESDSLLGMIF
jgi:hypothetical protein